jgi:hypothetical protein
LSRAFSRSQICNSSYVIPARTGENRMRNNVKIQLRIMLRDMALLTSVSVLVQTPEIFNVTDSIKILPEPIQSLREH